MENMKQIAAEVIKRAIPYAVMLAIALALWMIWGWRYWHPMSDRVVRLRNQQDHAAPPAIESRPSLSFVCLGPLNIGVPALLAFGPPSGINADVPDVYGSAIFRRCLDR